MSEESNRNDSEETERNANPINRRCFVRTVGAVGTGALTMGFASSASAEAIDSENVRQSRSVRTLLNALGNPTVNNRETELVTLERAEIAYVSFGTDFGQLVHGEIRSSNHADANTQTSAVYFDFNNLNDVSLDKLPFRFEDLPSGITASLLYAPLSVPRPD